jgi:hypothetical protein
VSRAYRFDALREFSRLCFLLATLIIAYVGICACTR